MLRQRAYMTNANQELQFHIFVTGFLFYLISHYHSIHIISFIFTCRKVIVTFSL
jgi:hypothetical protein